MKSNEFTGRLHDLSRRDLIGMSAGTAAIATAAAVAANAAMPNLAQAQAQAGGKLQEVLRRGRVIVGTGSTNPPWHFEDSNGQLVGMDIDMARLVAKGLFNDPTKVEFVRQGSDARIPALMTNKIDVNFQFMTVTAGRAQQVAFTIPYYREGVTFLLLGDSKYKDHDALKAAGNAVKVSAMQNVFIEAWVHEALPQSKVDQYDSMDSSLQALNARRSDAYLTDQSAARWLIAQFPGRYRDAGYGYKPNLYSASVRYGDPDWLHYVNTVLIDAISGLEWDSYRASFKKWFGEDVPGPKVGFPWEFR
jgi:polar amino acid transport system substrate-binding protein